MSKEGGVRKVPEAGRVISHSIGVAGEVILQRQVTMVPLVKGMVPEDGGRGRCSSNRAPPGPKQGGQIVRVGLDRAFADIKAVGRDGVVQEGTE